MSQGQHGSQCERLPEFFCNSAITRSLIFNQECVRNRLSAVCFPCGLGELTALSRWTIWIWWRDPRTGKWYTGRKIEKRKRKERKGQDSIPALPFFTSRPGLQQHFVLIHCVTLFRFAVYCDCWKSTDCSFQSFHWILYKGVDHGKTERGPFPPSDYGVVGMTIRPQSFILICPMRSRYFRDKDNLYPFCLTIIHCMVLNLCVCFILYLTCMELRLVSFLLNEYVMLCYVMFLVLFCLVLLRKRQTSWRSIHTDSTLEMHRLR